MNLKPNQSHRRNRCFHQAAKRIGDDVLEERIQKMLRMADRALKMIDRIEARNKLRFTAEEMAIRYNV